MAYVSGDTWHPDRHSPYMNAVEYFNYSNRDITLVDKLGCETELLRRSENPFDIGDRGYIVIRVTRLVDPRRVVVPETGANNEIDQIFLHEFRNKVLERREQIIEGTSGYNQCKMIIQFEIRLKPESRNINYKSELLGIFIKESEDYSVTPHVATPDGFINRVMVPDLIEMDKKDDEGKEKGIRTICSARLIDNNKRVGTLWTNMFGTATKIEPVKDEEQQEGLYLAGGHNLEIKRFIPIAQLLEPKALIEFGLFITELECKKNSTGEYTASVITERDKTKKENRSLRDENSKLSQKVTVMELDAKAEKVNKAHSEYKHTRNADNMKDYYEGNTLALGARLADKLLMLIKGGLSLLAAFKLIKSFI
uniref:Uncharacterized protein n=1 Tax=Pantoea phage Survivor TaxID=3232176 RepID=A0AAU8L100_9CAUD